MKSWSERCLSAMLMIALAGVGLASGCDSGDKAVNEVTGNRAVKQYHESKKKADEIADREAEKYKNIPGDENKGGENK